MSESPWNVKNSRPSAPKPLSPQSAQVKHVPLNPPALPRRRAKPAPKNEPSAQPRIPRQEPVKGVQVRSRRSSIKGKRPVSILFMCMIAVLAMSAAAAGIILASNQQKLEKLIMTRQAEEQRLLAHKQEHLNARGNSGYNDLIWKYALEYGVSPSFISAVIKCESSYNPSAVSRVDARGLMQIMPDTGIWLAGKLNMSNYQPDSLFDPETNIRFGAYYLAYLSDMFNGSPIMVASAYHAGANNVKLWALSRAEDMKTIGIEQIPMEDTLSYVRKVMDAYAIYYEKDQGSPVAGTGYLFDLVSWGSTGH